MEEFQQKFDARMAKIQAALDGMRELDSQPIRLLMPIIKTEAKDGRDE
jgi:hypothetical protein